MRTKSESSGLARTRPTTSTGRRRKSPRSENSNRLRGCHRLVAREGIARGEEIAPQCRIVRLTEYLARRSFIARRIVTFNTKHSTLNIHPRRLPHGAHNRDRIHRLRHVPRKPCVPCSGAVFVAGVGGEGDGGDVAADLGDRKSTRLNSSHT